MTMSKSLVGTENMNAEQIEHCGLTCGGSEQRRCTCAGPRECAFKESRKPEPRRYPTGRVIPRLRFMR